MTNVIYHTLHLHLPIKQVTIDIKYIHHWITGADLIHKKRDLSSSVTLEHNCMNLKPKSEHFTKMFHSTAPS